MIDIDGTVTIIPGSDWYRQADEACIPSVNRVLREVYKDVLRGVPVLSYALRDSVEMVPAKVTPIGRIKVGGPGLEYWADQEYGTDPHVIESTGDWPLRNKETGQVFGRRVNHPGNAAQPYLRPAVYRQRAL